MNKPYIVLINGVLAACHITRVGALRHIEQLKIKGIKAVIAYRIEDK